MSHLKNKVARRTARLTSVLLAVLMILTVAPIIAFPASAADPTNTLEYRIVHLDCGRKYFSVANIKKLIVFMAQYGYNQLQLAFGNDGFRFILEDMSLSYNDSNGNLIEKNHATVKSAIQSGNATYTASSDEEDNKCLTESDMNEILACASDNGIEIVPLMNMPGHAKAMVSYFNYGTTDGSVNLSNTEAKNYALAMLSKYVEWFRGKVNFFNFGADEYNNFSHDCSTVDSFVSECVDIITAAGMTPRAFNDSICYNNNKNCGSGINNKELQVCHWGQGWSGYNTSKASTIKGAGFDLINTNGNWYYVLKENQSGSSYYTVANSNATIELPTLKNYKCGLDTYAVQSGSETVTDGRGVMFCIWCDSYDAITDGAVISDCEYGALTQLKTLAEYYWSSKSVTATDSTKTVSVTANGIGKVTLTTADAPTISDAASDKIFAYDVKPYTLDGIGYTSSGVVAFKIPDGWNADRVRGFVVNEDSTVTDNIIGAVENGYFKFSVNHFSVMGIYQLSDDAAQKTDTIRLTIGETASRTQSGDVSSNIDGLDESIANVSAKYKYVSGGTEKTIGDVISVSNQAKSSGVISDGNGNYMVVDATGVISNTSDINQASVFTVVRSGNWSWDYSYTISCGSYYLVIKRNGGNYSLDTSTTNDTSWKYSDGFYYSGWDNYYLAYSNGSWAAASQASGKLYSVTTTTIDPVDETEIEFTGVAKGTTTVTIGDTKYTIIVDYIPKTITIVKGDTITENVTGSEIKEMTGSSADVTLANGVLTITAKEEGPETSFIVGDTKYTVKVIGESLDNVPDLSVELWVTNQPVGKDKSSATTSGNKITITAAEAYGEDGIYLRNFVPKPCYDSRSDSEYTYSFWKGVVLHKGMRQNDSNAEKYSGDMSSSGDDFYKIRYYGGDWQYYSGNEWKDIDGSTTNGDTVIAYYLQDFVVSPEIGTHTKDWGGAPSFKKPAWAQGLMGTGFAVVYPDGSINRTEEEIYKNINVRYWYSDGRDSNSVGVVAADNNGDYRIAKITITKGFYSTTDERRTVAGDWSASGAIVWEKVTNEAGTEWYKEETIWKSSGDESTNDVISIDFRNLKDEDGKELWKATQFDDAFLILIYLEPVAKEDNLRVVYWDDNAGKQINTKPIEIVVNENVNFLNGLRNATVKDGVVTLPDNAYITNSSGIDQTFNKDITILEGVAANYRSGIYEYVGATVSEDGKTLTLHYNLMEIDEFHDYIIDFGLPLTFNDILGWFSVTNVSAVDYISVASAKELTESTGLWGSVKIDKDTWNSMTYTLDKVLRETATIPLYCKLKDGTQRKTCIRVYPASTVYYEEGFITPDTTDGKKAWSIGESKYSDYGYGAEALIPSYRRETNPYGYNSSYAKEDTGYSHGTAMTVNVKDAETASASFTFTGTGFDLISATGYNTGAIFLDIFQGTTTDGEPIKRWVVDTYYGYKYAADSTNPWLKCEWKYTNGEWHVTKEPITESELGKDGTVPSNPKEGATFTTYEPNYLLAYKPTENDSDNTLYQIPVISFNGFAHGTYTVVITAKYNAFFDHTSAGSYTVCIDGVRIYNTLDKDSKDAEIYKEDGEYYPEFIRIRDKLISSEDVTGNVNGAAFIDAIGKTSKSDLIRNYGPNNEVYLAADQTITFKLTTKDVAKLMLGLKALKGTANVTVTVNNGTPMPFTLSTATDMYYLLDGTGATGDVEYDIVINNTGSALVSVTTLKVTHNEKPATQSLLTVNADLIAEAKAIMLSLIQPEVPVFTPERFEASWSTVTLFRNSVHALVVRTSTDVDHITVDGKEITNFYYAAAFEGWGRNRKLVKYKVFTLFLGNDATIGDYEVVAFDADGVASEAHIATLTGKTGVGKFN